jgi:hypothetical protein
MDKDTKRAERRAEVERIKKKRCNYWGFYNEEMSEKRLGIVSQTPKTCNCWMCSKPRKHTLSIAEIRQQQSGLQEFDLDSNE